MDIITPAPQKICPICSVQQDDERCRYDRAYLVTQEAYMSAQGDRMLGQEIGGRYGIIKRLGMGGMGAVYQAVDSRSKTEVAIKVLRETYAQHPAIRERFIREAEAGAALNHPNVVPLVDFGIEDDGRLWLAMEFVKGWTLRDEINHNGAFRVKEAIELMKQVLRGLAVAHDAGLIHRDLKHDNIMYHGRREKFEARIVDFGVVKSAAADLDRSRSGSYLKKTRLRKGLGRDQDGAFDLSEAFRENSDQPSNELEKPEDDTLEQKALTAVGMMVGSPSYMAPEQIRGLKVGPPADLYALAVVAYEILVARRLFTVNDYETLLKEDAKREAPQLVFSARGELIPEAFSEIIHIALAHDPTDRYPDAHTMLLALDQMKLTASVIPVHLFCELPNYSGDINILSETTQSASTPPKDQTNIPEIETEAPAEPQPAPHEHPKVEVSLAEQLSAELSTITSPVQHVEVANSTDELATKLTTKLTTMTTAQVQTNTKQKKIGTSMILLIPIILGGCAWIVTRLSL